MNAIKSKALFCAVLTVLFISCDKNNDSTPSPGEIWPLKLNNEWTFLFTAYKEDGSIKEQSIDNWKITGDTLINGNKFQRVNSGGLYLRNADANTVEAMGPSNVVLPYLKQTKIDNDNFYSTITTIYITSGSCPANSYRRAYTGTININRHACLKNEEIYEDCSGGIRMKIINFYKPSLGLVAVEKYTKKITSSGLYLMSKEILQSYKLY